MENVLFGGLNAYVLGIVMKEAVRRAIIAIRSQRFTFERENKIGRNGNPDLVTSADRAAQDIYLKMLCKSTPDIGIEAEEDGASVPCTLPNVDAFFTVDGIDGTKAFGRRQSHGIGTMLALVYGRKIVAAYVGDVSTQEIYGFRPDAESVQRISEFDHSEPLRINPDRPLAEQSLLVRNERLSDSALTIRLENGRERFRRIESGNGSLGISFARLWKGEVGGMILQAGAYAAWDWCPIIGISQKMGFEFMEFHGGQLRTFVPPVSRQLAAVPSEVLIVHGSKVADVSRMLCI